MSFSKVLLCGFFTTLVLLSCYNKKEDKLKTGPMNRMIADSSIGVPRGSAGIIFIDVGGNGGIPVLFIHSFGGSTEHWNDQLKHIRETI